jgi:hypothetical protein
VSAVVINHRKFREVDERLLHLKGLILVRGLLEQRGASEAELQEHSDEIARVRAELAQLVRTSGLGTSSLAA